MSIDAMKAALEVVEMGDDDHLTHLPRGKLILALQAAIEQAEKQGRATAIDNCPYDTSPATDYWIEGWLACAALEQAEKQEPHFLHCICGAGWEISADGGEELVGAPPQRQLLTEGEMFDIAEKCGCASADWIDFARAVERAHGIGNKA